LRPDGLCAVDIVRDPRDPTPSVIHAISEIVLGVMMPVKPSGAHSEARQQTTRKTSSQRYSSYISMPQRPRLAQCYPQADAWPSSMLQQGAAANWYQPDMHDPQEFSAYFHRRARQ